MSVYRNISVMNSIPIYVLRCLIEPFCPVELWIEDGKITGYVEETTGKLHKEIPTQTANPSGD